MILGNKFLRTRTENDMSIKITTLIENHPHPNIDLFYEHGISMYINAYGKKILFDTGLSGDFIKNAQMLGIDLSDLDVCLISHGHYDHAGGFRKLVDNFKVKQVVVGSEFFDQKYKKENDEYHANGVEFDEEFCRLNGIDCVKIENEDYQIDEKIMVFHHFSKTNDFEEIEPRFYLKENNQFVNDKFHDEIVLGIVSDNGLILLVGCSHIGIVNIVEHIKTHTRLPIRAIIGGTHLNKASDERIQKTIQHLDQEELALLAASHCTGDKAMDKMKDYYHLKFQLNHTGHIIEL